MVCASEDDNLLSTLLAPGVEMAHHPVEDVADVLGITRSIRQSPIWWQLRFVTVIKVGPPRPPLDLRSCDGESGDAEGCRCTHIWPVH